MRRIAPAALLVSLAAAAGHAQTITSISQSTVERSGRLVILGSGFGGMGGGGRVLVGGVEAHISQWSPSRIHAYIAEPTPLGPTEVVVQTTGVSNPVPVAVAARPPADGRVRWRFQLDDGYMISQPAVGPDGTIYAVGASGHLYALAPDGGLRWIYNTVVGTAAPDVGPDGTIYVGGAPVTAINPDGTLKWRSEPVGGNIFVGPSVGPDGNIYGATGRDLSFGDTFIGQAFVISPDGDLLSARRGPNYRHQPYGWEVAFTADAAYFNSGMGGPTYGEIGLISSDLGGGLNWLRGGLGQGFAGASGNAYTADPGGNRVVSYDPSGSTRWAVTLNTLGGQPAHATLAPDETFFMSIQWGRFWAINADGSIRWSARPFMATDYPRASPDSRQVVVSGVADFNAPRVVAGLDTADGEVLWSVDLPRENDVWITPYWYPEFSADGATVYVPTSGPNYITEPYAYLYAIDTRLQTSCTADCDANGTVTLADFTCFRNLYVAGDAAADCDGNGSVTLADFVCFRGHYVQGCP